MPRYRDTFKLDINDIDLIERALREQVASAHGGPGAPVAPRAVQDLLGRLHAQKIFYSHTGTKPIPNG